MASSIRCLVTAGPTREYFDPVRFISNPSTGKMGFALAAAAVEVGWEVDLVAGPVALPSPDGLRQRTNVETAQEMLQAVEDLFPFCDILIMTAAVSDLRPAQRLPQKVKKEQLGLSVTFERTPDILLSVSRQKLEHQILVGFAAETEEVEEHARGKMQRKGCSFMVANRVGGSSGGFADDVNTVLLLGSDGLRQSIGPAPKTEVARVLIAQFQRALGGR